MDFKGKEINDVLRALKEANKSIYASQLQRQYLTDWQPLKVEAIFEYLYDNYKHKFDNADKSNIYGYLLQYSSDWDDDMEKGGFEKFWEHREKAKISIKKLLNNAGAATSVIQSVLKILDRF